MTRTRLAVSTAGALVKAGGDTWFFITVDYAAGHALEKDTSDVIKANGGKVLGHVLFPLNAPDFSSFLLQAQSSKAKIVALATRRPRRHQFDQAGGGIRHRRRRPAARGAAA